MSASTVERDAAVGEQASIGSWTVTVNNFVPDASEAVAAANEFNPKPADGHVYALVNVTVQRVSDPGSVFSLAFTLDGLPSAAAEAPDRLDLIAPADPAAPLTGNIVFELGKSAPSVHSLKVSADGETVNITLP